MPFKGIKIENQKCLFFFFAKTAIVRPTEAVGVCAPPLQGSENLADRARS